MDDRVKKYELSGGSLVEVHQIFGKEYYIALLDSKGDYPGEGKIARDKGRVEYVVIISGEFTAIVNGKSHNLKGGDNLLINDGDSYEINGVGKALVFVHDQKGGQTEIISKK